MALAKGLLLAALLLAPCVLGQDGSYGLIPTICDGGECDPSNHIEDITIHYTNDDGSPSTCVALFDFLDARPDLSLWRDLLLRYRASLSLDQRPGTILIPSDKAILKNLAEINYDWAAFLNLGDTILLAIIEYNIIPGTKIMSSDVNWSYPLQQTLMPLTFIQFRPNKWRTFSVNGTFTYADVMPDCADQVTCNAVVQITTGLMVPFKLPARAAPYEGCFSLYQYIGSRGDMQHLKAAIDKVTNINDGTNRSLAQVLDNQRLVATVFLPTDPVWDAWIAVAQLSWAGQNTSVPVVHLDDLPANVIAAILFNHIVAGYQYQSCDFISGYMLRPMSPRYLLVDREDGRVKLWADLSNAFIVYPDINTCSVILHLVNWPLLPAGFDVTQWNYKGHADDDASYTILQTSGSFARFGDLVCQTPVLSGFRDLMQGTQLGGLANDETILLTWFVPSNMALLNMAARTGWMTNDFFANSKYRLNFLDYHAIPYSSLPSSSWADGQQLATAYKPNSITVYTQGGFACQGQLNPAKTLLQPAYDDIVCGKALANLLITGEPMLTDFRGLQ